MKDQCMLRDNFCEAGGNRDKGKIKEENQWRGGTRDRHCGRRISLGWYEDFSLEPEP